MPIRARALASALLTHLDACVDVADGDSATCSGAASRKGYRIGCAWTPAVRPQPLPPSPPPPPSPSRAQSSAQNAWRKTSNSGPGGLW